MANESYDRKYWETQTSTENLEVVDNILSVINRTSKHKYALKYNKAFIGFQDSSDGSPCHFVVIYPQKKQCTVSINVRQDSQFDSIIAAVFGETKYKDGWYNFKVSSDDVSNFEKLNGVLLQAEAELRKEVSIIGTKKIGTIQREFNQIFQYLSLGIFDESAKKKVANGESIHLLPEDSLLASVRRKDSHGDVSVNGNKKIKTIEAEFEEFYGLFCQICYTASDGSRYYTSGADDEKTLSKFNDECEKNGCKKGIYR